MKRSKRIPGELPLMHILLGQPDENCEVCRAHGLDGHDFPDGAAGMVVVDMGPLDEILGCPCPLCSQIDFEMLDGDRGPDPGESRDA